MRQSDEDLHPAAVARRKKEVVKFYAGLGIAAAGLAAVFLLEEVYVGFAVALVGANIVPFDKLNPFNR